MSTSPFLRDGVAFLHFSTEADRDNRDKLGTVATFPTVQVLDHAGVMFLGETLGEANEYASSLTQCSPPGLEEQGLASENGADAHEQKPLPPDFNFGSVGHPFLCRLDCSFFPVEECSRGRGCGYCHKSHEGMLMKLDGTDKKFLRSMEPEVRERLLGAVLREKMHQMLAVLPSGERFVQEWQRGFGAISSVRSFKAISPDCRRLIRHLRQMNVGILSALATNNCGDCALVEATDKLLALLRAQFERLASD